MTGKGDEERNVFFGEQAQVAIRVYLALRQDDLIRMWLRHDNRRGRPGLAVSAGVYRLVGVGA